MDPLTTAVVVIWSINLVLERAVLPALKNGKARVIDCGILGKLAVTPQEFEQINRSAAIRQGRRTYNFYSQAMRGAAQ
jgi:hypothetical protein